MVGTNGRITVPFFQLFCMFDIFHNKMLGEIREWLSVWMIFNAESEQGNHVEGTKNPGMICSLLALLYRETSKCQGSETGGKRYPLGECEYFWAEMKVLERGAEVVVAKSIYVLGSNPSSALASFVTWQKLLLFSVFGFFIDRDNYLLYKIALDIRWVNITVIIIFLGKLVLSKLFKAWGLLHVSTLFLVEWETIQLEEGKEGGRKGNSGWS